MAEKKGKSIEAALERLRKRLEESPSVTTGDLDLHLRGSTTGDFRISARGGKTTINREAVCGSQPVLEVWGDADTVRAILDGEKDPVKQFLAGGLRVRGNLRALSSVGVELGILDKPL